VSRKAKKKQQPLNEFLQGRPPTNALAKLP